MKPAVASSIAAALGALAVAQGAFGAHGLKHLLESNGTSHVWEKAVFYHLIHAVMLFLLAEARPFRPVAWWCFFVGIILFSGSLYALALLNVGWLGPITPFGGLAFIIGWVSLAWPRGASAK